MNKGFDVVLTSSLSFDLAIIISLVKYTVYIIVVCLS